MGRRLRLLLTLSLVLVCAPMCSAFLDPVNDPDVKKFVDTEDDGFSRAATSEYTYNRGTQASVRCKSSQEMVVMKFDLSSLAGMTITAAELHVCASSSTYLYAADVSTICVPWSQGTKSNSTAAVGDPCWSWRHYPANVSSPQATDYWLPGATNFSYASFGNNGSLVSWAYPGDGSFTTYSGSTPGGTKTFYRIQLDPDMIHALILDQYGLTLSDTRGYLLQNNTVYTRDQWGGSAGPWLYIKGGITDTTPPGPVTGFVARPGEWNGQVLLSFLAPTDSGPKGKAFGYDVRYSTSAITAANFASATQVDRWRIPRPATPGTTQKVLMDGLTPNTTYYFAMKAYDQAGNATAMVTSSVVLPATQTTTPFTNGGFSTPASATAVPGVANVLNYWAVSDYTKVNPVTGSRRVDGYTSPVNNAYKMANPVWDAVNSKVVLNAAKNEVVAFQLILEKVVASLTNVQVTVSDLVGPDTIAASNIELSRVWYINKGAYYPFACVPLKAPFGTSFAIPNADNGISGQTIQSIWADVYVPKEVHAGTYTGTITVQADQLSSPLTVGVKLNVRKWQIPDEVSFVVNLNSYGAPWNWGVTGQDVSATKLNYFQLAQKHRQAIDTVPYSHTLDNATKGYTGRFNDSTRQFSLTGNGASTNVSSWTTFDSYWGQYLDGTAFTAANGYNGPGIGKPISMMFLPFFDSYPLSSYWWYDATGLGGAYWYGICPGPTLNSTFLAAAPNPATAYPTSYETGLKNVVKAFMEHAQTSGWHGTNFEFFHNSKYSFGTSTNPHSQFWNLDEPSEGDCFQALGYFHGLWRKGAESANAPDVKRSYRIDISDRTGLNRGALDGKVNLWDCSSVDDYHNMVPWRQLQWPDEKWWYYFGGSDATSKELTNPQRFLQVWCWYVDGALPFWDCFSGQHNWSTEGDPYQVVLSGLSVPGQNGTIYNGGFPTIRMKEMRRGQQDVEYLARLTQVKGWSRAAVIRAMQAKYADTGGQAYSGMNELSFFKLREDVSASIPFVGDINGDGVVNVLDLQILVSTWGLTRGNPGFLPSADLNGDGAVNVGDLQLLIASWGL